MNIHIYNIMGSKFDPASRFRFKQYEKIIEKYNIKFFTKEPVLSKYPPQSKIKRPFWGILVLLERFKLIQELKNYDCIFLTRELISKQYIIERFIKKKIIFDIDDAIWLHGNFCEKIVKKSSLVICGNKYIFEWAQKYNERCIIIPTAVDTDRFKASNTLKDNNKIIIGWSGTSGGFKYIYKIEEALNYICQKYNNVIIQITSNDEPKFELLNSEKILFSKWSENNEVEVIQNFDIGIMPLNDDEWTKGKCSYKMLLYMACEKPVVVSNIGMNVEILNEDKIGFGCSSIEEWKINLEKLILDKQLRNLMGKNGRLLVEEKYSLKVNAKKISKEINSVLLEERMEE